MTYKVVIYNGNDRSFEETEFNTLEEAVDFLKWSCNDIIDDFVYDGIHVTVITYKSIKADMIRIADVKDLFGNYYVCFIKVD